MRFFQDEDNKLFACCMGCVTAILIVIVLGATASSMYQTYMKYQPKLANAQIETHGDTKAISFDDDGMHYVLMFDESSATDEQ